MNVGNGDCTIVELPDNRIMLIDLRNARRNMGSTDSDYENPITYLSSITSSSSIFRYVLTHPELDHMDGLHDLLGKYSIVNFWDTENTRKKPSDFSYGFREEDWNAYQELRKSAHYFTRSTTAIGLNGGTFPYDIFVISPSEGLTNEANEKEDWNLLSYVLLIEYKGFKVLFGGDASDSAWADIYEYAQGNRDAKRLLSDITIFKASHHGRNTSYCGADMLNLMNPQKIVISKGSIPGDQSAYGKYYDWAKGADNMFLTSKGTIVADYYDSTNRKYSIRYK